MYKNIQAELIQTRFVCVYGMWLMARGEWLTERAEEFVRENDTAHNVWMTGLSVGSYPFADKKTELLLNIMTVMMSLCVRLRFSQHPV